jgi:glycosyltransferase involved in cell wall biosynthesis
LHLSGELAKRGCELYVLLPKEVGNAAARLAAAGVVVHQLRLVRPRGTLRHLPYFVYRYPAQIARLARYLREVDADLVEIHGLQHMDGALAAKLVGVPIVWQLIDTRPSPLAKRLGMPLVCRLADVIMTTGQAVAESYPGAISAGERLITFVPPIAAPLHRSRFERTRIRKRLEISEESFLIVSIGNLNPQKGHDVLLQAVSVICAEDVSVTVVIRGAVQHGHEPYAAYLRALSDQAHPTRVTVEELEPWLTVGDLLAAADLFTLPSRARSEGIPTVVLEALASGVPVLASNVGAVAEVLDPDAGELVAPGDASALENAIRQLIAQPARLASMAASAQSRSSELGSPTVFADRQWLAYQRALGLRQGSSEQTKPQRLQG